MVRLYDGENLHYLLEFACIRKINVKVDVYSYGVVLLDLTTGRRATGEDGGHENLAQWAWRQFQEEISASCSFLHDGDYGFIELGSSK